MGEQTLPDLSTVYVTDKKSEVKEESKSKGQSRPTKRAWKCRYDVRQETEAEGMSKCAYISRRTNLKCENIRPADKLSPEGFCEAHVRFFKQLAEYSEVEEKRICKNLLNVECSIFDEMNDETLATVSDWPSSECYPNHDHSVDDGDGDDNNNGSYDDVDDNDDPLRNAKVLTDEELARRQVTILRRKLEKISLFRKLLAQKAWQSIRYYKGLQDGDSKKKTSFTAEPHLAVTKSEDHNIEVTKANKKYFLPYDFGFDYMRRRAEAKYKQQMHGMSGFDYLKTDYTEGGPNQCLHFSMRGTESEQNDLKQVAEVCDEVAVSSNDHYQKSPPVLFRECENAYEFHRENAYKSGAENFVGKTTKSDAFSRFTKWTDSVSSSNSEDNEQRVIINIMDELCDRVTRKALELEYVQQQIVESGKLSETNKLEVSTNTKEVLKTAVSTVTAAEFAAKQLPSETTNDNKNYRCGNFCLPRNNYCVQHICDDAKQVLFARCSVCSNLSWDFCENVHFCYRHRDEKHLEAKELGKDCKAVCRGKDYKPRNTLLLDTCESREKFLHALARASEGGGRFLKQNPDSSSLRRLALPSTSNGCSSSFSKRKKDEGYEPPMKYVVIGEEAGDEEATKHENLTEICNKSSVLTSNDGPVVKASENSSQQQEDTSSRSLLTRSANLTEGETCARTRTFERVNFNKSRMKKALYLTNPGGIALRSTPYPAYLPQEAASVHDPAQSKVQVRPVAINHRVQNTTGPSFRYPLPARRATYDSPTFMSSESSALGWSGTSSPATRYKQIIIRSRGGLSSPGSPRLTFNKPNSTQAFHPWRGPVAVRRLPSFSHDHMERSPKQGSFVRVPEERQFLSGNARSRLIAVDSTIYSSRNLSQPSYGISSCSRSISRNFPLIPQLRRPISKVVSQDSLETAAAVASIADELSKSPEKNVFDDIDEFLAPVSQPVEADEKPLKNQIREDSSTLQSDGSLPPGAQRNDASQSTTVERRTDGLDVLAMAAASRAEEPKSRVTKDATEGTRFDDYGLEEEAEDDS